MATINYKSLASSLKQYTDEPSWRELKQYLHSIGSSPCAVTMEAAVSYHLEMQKLRRVGRCLKILNRRDLETQQYESEEGVGNLPRVQRRYLLKSMEVNLRRSEKNHQYFTKAAQDETTPVGGKPDSYFCRLLLQWYTETAQEAAELILAKWADPVVNAVDVTASVDQTCTLTVSRPSEPVLNKARELELKRVSSRSPPVFSDDESGSDKAPSGDELGSEEDDL